MTQPSLDFTPQPQRHAPRRSDFYGPDLTPADQVALGDQIQAIYDLMQDGQWRTVQEIAQLTHFAENSISAQLRNLRKPRHGGYDVPKRLRTGCARTYEYRVVR